MKYLIQNDKDYILLTDNLVMAKYELRKIMDENLTTNKYKGLFEIRKVEKDGSTSPVPSRQQISAEKKLENIDESVQFLLPKLKEVSGMSPSVIRDLWTKWMIRRS